MALCVSMLIAAEFMPVSLLTPIARDLRATEGMAGQAISISGLFALVASLLIATVAGRYNRRHVLLGLTGVMLASLILIAVAPNFLVLISHVLFWAFGRRILVACHATNALCQRKPPTWHHLPRPSYIGVSPPRTPVFPPPPPFPPFHLSIAATFIGSAVLLAIASVVASRARFRPQITASLSVPPEVSGKE